MFPRGALNLCTLFVLMVRAYAVTSGSFVDQSELCFPGNETSQFIKDYTVLYNYLTGTGAHNFSESVTIGFLGAYGQAQVVLGALPLAIEAVNKNNR